MLRSYFFEKTISEKEKIILSNRTQLQFISYFSSKYKLLTPKIYKTRTKFE